MDGAEGVAGDGHDEVDHVGGAGVLGGLGTDAAEEAGPEDLVNEVIFLIR